MRFISKVIFASLLLQSVALADSYFSVVQDANINFPSEMLVGQPGLAKYVVTNVVPLTETIHLNDLPSGFSVDDTPGYCQNGTQLASGASCTLELSYTASAPITILDYLPKVCPFSSTDIGCVAPQYKMSFQEVTSLSSTAPTLSTTSNTIPFAPGETSYITVRNNGTQNVNDARLILPDDILEQVDIANSTLVCPYIAPSGTCQLSVSVGSGLALRADTPFVIRSSNANGLSLVSTTLTTLVQAPNLTLTAPNTDYPLTITNNDNSTISNLTINGTLPSNVSQTATGCTSSLAARTSCTVTYRATANAYGTSVMSINFTDAGGTAQTSSFNLIVPNTTIAINPGVDNVGRDIAASVTGSFLIKNTGTAYNWQPTSVSRSGQDTWLTLTNGCTNALAPGATCSVSYQITGNHDFSSTITAIGANTASTSQDLEPNYIASIGIEGSSDQLHLMARAVKVTNLTTSPLLLTGVTATVPSSLVGKVVLCDSSGSNCPNAITTCSNGSSIVAGGSCYFWFQTNPNNTDPLTADMTDTTSIQLTATPTIGGQAPQILARTIEFTYGKDLYVGSKNGAPIGLGSVTSLARFDGTNWSAVGSAQLGGSTIEAISNYNNDLFIGGDFTSAGGDANAQKIARWNGSSWSALSGGSAALSSGTVYALKTYNNILYVGGSFNGLSGMDYLVQYDGASLSFAGNALLTGSVFALEADGDSNGSIYAGGFYANSDSLIRRSSSNNWEILGNYGSVEDLLRIDTDLYVGGLLLNAGSNLGDRIARWSSSSSNWNALGSGLNSPVYALAANGSIVYAGGSFTQSPSPFPSPIQLSRIGQWSGSAWSAMGSGFVSGVVRALDYNGSILYAGGSIPDTISKWDGTSWTTLGSGFSVSTGNYVASIKSYPHLILDNDDQT